MTSPQFLGWLEGKFEELEVKKVIPPRKVLTDRLLEEAEKKYRENLTAKILAESKFEDRVSAKRDELERATYVQRPELLERRVERALEEQPVLHWSGPVVNIAGELGKAEK